MRRILIAAAAVSLLFVFAAPADAGPVRRLIDRFRRDKPAVEKKVTKEVDRERKVLRVRPAYFGGVCPLK